VPTAAAQQVQERKQENPNDVHKMPVEAAKLDRRMVFRGESVPPGHSYEGDHHTRPYYHMKSMQASHREIEAEKNLGLIRIGAFNPEVKSGNQVVFEFLGVFYSFDTQEYHPQEHRRAQEEDQPFAIAPLCVEHRRRHSEAAADQNQSIDEPELRIEFIAGYCKDFRVCQVIDSVCGKQAAEEQDFGRKKNPHSQGSSLSLLLRIIELMGERRVVGAGYCIGLSQLDAPPP